jgi:hypothetical protein
MNNAKLSHSYRQFLVATIARIEDQAVTGTIHRLERPFFFLDVQSEHVIFVILPVPGRFPKFRVEHIGGDHWRTPLGYIVESEITSHAFLISTLKVLALKIHSVDIHQVKHGTHPQQFHKGIVNASTVRKPKCATRT